MTDLFQEAETPVIDESKKYLEDLVGEGKKFKDVESLARGKYEADFMIETMKRRMDELREDHLKLKDEHQASAKLQELIDRLESSPRQPQTNSEQPDAKDVKVPNPQEIEDLVASKVQEFVSAQKQEENYNKVVGKLKERHGNNFANVLKEQTANMGLSQDDVRALARKSPDAFERIFGLNEVKQDLFQSPPGSTHRTDLSMAPKKRTWSYYQDLKQKDPKAYHNPKTQVQMHNDYIALGEAFEDGDFKRSWSI